MAVQCLVPVLKYYQTLLIGLNHKMAVTQLASRRARHQDSRCRLFDRDPRPIEAFPGSGTQESRRWSRIFTSLRLSLRDQSQRCAHGHPCRLEYFPAWYPYILYRAHVGTGSRAGFRTWRIWLVSRKNVDAGANVGKFHHLCRHPWQRTVDACSETPSAA